MGARRLVTLEHERGVAAVTRDAGGRVWLRDGVWPGGALIDGHRPAVTAYAFDVTLIGGLLPPGAVRAVVRDRARREHEPARGGGAWIALVRQPIAGERPPVRFLDARGQLVAVPLPAGLRLEAVPDADVACPACDAVDWSRVVAAPPMTYGGDGAGRPTAAVCARCGHEEHLGVLYAPLGGERDPDEAARVAAEVRRRRAEIDPAIAFALYGLAGVPAKVAGQGARDGVIDRVTLAFDTAAGRVDVETSTEEPFEAPEWVARGELERLLHEHDGPWPRLSETAVLLWLNARSRACAASAARAPLTALALPVDGAPVPFATVTHGGRFAATARLSDATVTVAGAGDAAGLRLATMHPSGI